MLSFKDLGINNILESILNKKGIKNPTTIQYETIPAILEGKDIIGEAPTGTGKTLAFLLPLFQNKVKNSDGKIANLIITPTRELAVQIENEIEKLNSDGLMKSLLVLGGKEIGGQSSKIEKGIDIVIATPGRLQDHINRKTIDLSKVKTLILDEADVMIELGFKNEIEEIVKSLPKKRQTILFSATLNGEIKKIGYRYTNTPIVVSVVEESNKFQNIEQYFVSTSDRKKRDALCQLINDENPFMGIIFCRTKVRVDKLDEVLYERGYKCQKLHSDIPQAKREKIMKSFKNLEVQFLIATDVAARGIDVQGVTHIFNFDIPENSDIYTHRIGRTGRAKEKGKAYTFITENEKDQFLSFVKELEINIEEKIVEHGADVQAINTLPETKYDKRINVSSKKIEAVKIIKKRANIKKSEK